MSTQLTDALFMALDLLNRARVQKREFDKLMQGVVDAGLPIAERELLRELSLAWSKGLEDMGAVVKVAHPVEFPATGQLPTKLRETYELLWIRTYGSGALFTGDGNAEKVGTAGQGWRLRSDKEQHRGPASRGRSLSASRRNVIQDQKAYDFKRAIDKRLERIARDVRAFLAGADTDEDETGVCIKCGRIAARGWKFCPHDGGRIAE